MHSCARESNRGEINRIEKEAQQHLFMYTHSVYVCMLCMYFVLLVYFLSTRWICYERNTVALLIINCPIKIELYCATCRTGGIKIDNFILISIKYHFIYIKRCIEKNDNYQKISLKCF